MDLKDCHNFADFRKLAQKKLPSPIFHYIDGAADDEVTYARNTSAFDDVDLVPNVLRGGIAGFIFTHSRSYFSAKYVPKKPPKELPIIEEGDSVLIISSIC